MSGTAGSGWLSRAITDIISSALNERPVTSPPSSVEEVAWVSGQRGTSQVESLPEAAVVLHGPIDAANQGLLRFSLFGVELQAVYDRPGGIGGGSYDVSQMALGRPVRLLGRDGQPMEVVVTRLHDGVECRQRAVSRDRLAVLRPFR